MSADDAARRVEDVQAQAGSPDLSDRLRQVYQLKVEAVEQEPLTGWLFESELACEQNEQMPLLYQADLDEHRRHPVVAERLERVKQIVISRQYLRKQD